MPLQPLDYQTPQSPEWTRFLASCRSKLTWKRVAVVAVLYIVTWIGGGLTYSRNLNARAWSMWQGGKTRDAQMVAFAKAKGLPTQSTRIHPQPTSHVDWCVPLLPGVLLADSSYHIGPLWGAGGPKLVIYYGFGTFEVPLGGWRA